MSRVPLMKSTMYVYDIKQVTIESSRGLIHLVSFNSVTVCYNLFKVSIST